MGSTARRQVGEGLLAQTVREALKLRAAMQADGASRAELDAALERTIRASWPFTREWKYICEACRDYGLEMAQCPGDATCGRSKPHLPHDFGTPCWCQAGAKFRQPAKGSAEDFTKATKVRQPTRFGR